MIDGMMVIDAVVHGFNFGVDNVKYPFLEKVIRMTYQFAFEQLGPQGDPRYKLTYEEFRDLFKLQPELMRQVVFAESETDIAVYHGVPMYGLFEDGSSPLWIGRRIAEALPHRMFLYADISPTHPDPLGWIDEFAAIPNVIGVKFYPVDMVEGRTIGVRLDDERQVFPLIERCRAKGIKVIAVHKAVPLGPIPRDLYRADDIAHAIEAFPDLQFEIVHGGFAFAEETAGLLAKYDNVWINLETNPCFALNFADKMADLLAPLLATGRHDRLIYGTGATGMHPRPFLEAFARFRMPPGYPRLDDDMMPGILAENFARLHGWDLPALQHACAADMYGIDKELAEPWRLVRQTRPAA